MYIEVVATATVSGYYTGTATSAAAGPITTVVTAIGPITGTAAVNATLTAGTLTPSGASVTYQWLRWSTSTSTFTPIAGATGNTYQLTANDLGTYIEVAATGTGNYSGTVNSAMVGPVKTAVIGIGAITGTDQVYSTLTAGDVTRQVRRLPTSG